MTEEYYREADEQIRRCINTLQIMRNEVENMLWALDAASKRVSWAYWEAKKEHEHQSEGNEK